VVLVLPTSGCWHETSEGVQQLNASYLYCIKPEGVDFEEWELLTERPIEYGGPYRDYMPIYNVTCPYPVHPGEVINITVYTVPNATIDIEFTYQIKNGLIRKEHQGYSYLHCYDCEIVAADETGIATIPWLVSNEIGFDKTFPDYQLVYMDISIYPPGPRWKYREPYWRNMSLATCYLCVFRVWA